MIKSYLDKSNLAVFYHYTENTILLPLIFLKL